ncbi:hypothetical protein FPOAC2_02605 [Fusarium poae]|jgi:hypothetical protein
MIIDNADNPSMFGVGQQVKTEEETEQQNQNVCGSISCAPQDTVLWTSRDGHITGTLVAARRSVEERSMKQGVFLREY